MIMETGFSAGLAQVKAKTLSGSSRVSRIRSGLGRVTRLSLFPYPGAIGIAGLGQIMARVTGLTHFPYPG
jgi:hypothetical protein